MDDSNKMQPQFEQIHNFFDFNESIPENITATNDDGSENAHENNK